MQQETGHIVWRPGFEVAGLLGTLQQLFHCVKVVNAQLLHLTVINPGKQGATSLIGEQFPPYAYRGTERYGRYTALQRVMNGLKHGTAYAQSSRLGSPRAQQVLQSGSIEKG